MLLWDIVRKRSLNSIRIFGIFYPYLTEIQPEDHTIHSGVSRLVMLDRYAQKDRELKTLGVGDIVLAVIKEDPKYPARGVGVSKDDRLGKRKRHH